MHKNISGGQSVRLAVLTALGVVAVDARSQSVDSGAELKSVEVVVVTGSYIRGTPEDAALPVDVLSAEDLEAQGAPTIVQLVKTITASQSALGESNRYNGATAGTASINLRGFGAARTLTLMNGRRLADNPIAGQQGGGANLNFIPQAAIGRVELLKDGAAATYGSDAIGGVVNFITRTDLDGLELDAEYSLIDDSDGDYQGNLAWGVKFDRGNVLIAGGYRHRSRLDIHERDWAIGPYEDPNYGGWTGAGNPGGYVLQSTTTPAFRDNGCLELGGVLTNGLTGQPTTAATVTGASTCRFQFTHFNDLVNDEDHYQAHAEVNFDLTDAVSFHAEASWAENDVQDQRLSPANLSTQFPTPLSLGGTSGSFAAPAGLNQTVRYNVPAYHPGLIELRSVCAAPLTAAQCTAMAGAAGVDINQTAWRAIAFAGHPTNPDKADHQDINAQAHRVSVGFNGDLGAMHWDLAATYMDATTEVSTNDLLVSRIQLALNGFGSLSGASDQCTPAERTAANRGDAAAGCYYFNPFTNSVRTSAATGASNPYYRGDVNPAVLNHPKLVEWLYGNYVNELRNEMLVVDAVVSGEMGLKLWGDNFGWALGAQYRNTEDDNRYGDFFNTAVSPCVDSVDDGAPGCAAPAGPLIFFGTNTNFRGDRDVYALFGELHAPITASFDATLAVRAEEYPGEIGSTVDPKLSLRWQALDWFAVRGSAGATFRAPGLVAVSPGCSTGVANLGGQYRAVETCGNASLQPEDANAYNFGLLFNFGGFTASIDYFLFEFEEELTIESSSRMFATMFPSGQPARCGQAAYAALEARFTFTNAGCSGANPGGNVLRIRTRNVNGPNTETSGYDVRAQYDWPSLLGGAVSIGAEATYLESFERGEFTLLEDPSIVIAAPEERAGKHDLVSQFFSYPRTRANAFLSYNRGGATVRWQTRFTQGTQAAFGTPANRWVQDASATGGFRQEPLGKTDDFIQHDLIVRFEAPWETVLTVSVQNVFDEEPSDAPSQYNYDYTNGNPLGRVFEANVKKRF